MKTARKRQVDGAAGLLLEDGIPDGGHDADDLDALAWSAVAVRRPSPARFRACELEVLPERIAVRPEFFREHFIDDRDGRAVGLRRLGGCECSSAEKRKADRQ